MSALIRVGHKGADAIVPGNTLASFDAARAAGVDMIEFDILSRRADGTGELYIAHDYDHLREAENLALADALAHLATPAFAGLRFDVDLKLPGYEQRAVDALREAGLLERSIISSMYLHSLDAIRAADPTVRLGWSVPRLRRDYTTDALTRIPALAIATGYRAVLPRIAARTIAAGRCDALMAHWRLITGRLADAVAGAGGELYAWTVDEPSTIARLVELGVTAVITNDPRLLGAYSAQAAAL